MKSGDHVDTWLWAILVGLVISGRLTAEEALLIIGLKVMLTFVALLFGPTAEMLGDKIADAVKGRRER